MMGSSDRLIWDWEQSIVDVIQFKVQLELFWNLRITLFVETLSLCRLPSQFGRARTV